MDLQFNLKNEGMKTLHEFKIVYSGSSFKSGIKIEKFIDNLKSIQELVKNVVEVNSEYGKSNNKITDIQEIRITPTKGSLIEEIAIVFSNPEVRSGVLTIIVGLFFYLISRRDTKKSEKNTKDKLDEIEDLISRSQLKNIKKLYEPLEQGDDKMQIIEDDTIKIEINFPEKEKITRTINEVEKELKTEELDEEHEGYISAINIDTNQLRFHSKNLDQSYPLEFNLPLNIIASLIGKQIKTKMKVKKFKDKVRKFELLSYEIMQKDLNEFIKKV